jgi:DNA-binding MarR family transcriptional regulator
MPNIWAPGSGILRKPPENASVVAKLDLLETTSKSKYVNMTDISPRVAKPRQPKSEGAKPAPARLADPSGGDPLWFVEALFLAYRDFIGEPDRILAEIGFGRAHHRVLYFVNRYRGMRVADLLEILQITKQSLARVLRELVKEGYIRQISGETDRRERLLYPTDKGTALAMRLTELQVAKLRKALSAAGGEGSATVAAFLQHMAPDTSRLAALRRNGRSHGAGEDA